MQASTTKLLQAIKFSFTLVRSEYERRLCSEVIKVPECEVEDCHEDGIWCPIAEHYLCEAHDAAFHQAGDLPMPQETVRRIKQILRWKPDKIEHL